MYRSEGEQMSTLAREHEERNSGKGFDWMNDKSKGLKTLADDIGRGANTNPTLQYVYDEMTDEAGFINQMKISDAEKYTCTLILIKELGALYKEIGSGSATPTSMVTLVRERFAQIALRRSRQSTVGAAAESKTAKPVIEGELLKYQIDEKVNQGQDVTPDEINQLLLLQSWAQSTGADFYVSEEELQRYRSYEYKDVNRLHAEQVEADEQLVQATATGAIRFGLIEGASETLLKECFADLEIEHDYLTSSVRYAGTVEERRRFAQTELPYNQQRALATELMKRGDDKTLLTAGKAAKAERELYETRAWSEDGVLGKGLHEFTYNQLEQIARDRQYSSAARMIREFEYAIQNSKATEEQIIADLQRLAKQYPVSAEELADQRLYVELSEAKAQDHAQWEAEQGQATAQHQYEEQAQAVLQDESLSDERKRAAIVKINNQYDEENSLVRQDAHHGHARTV